MTEEELNFLENNFEALVEHVIKDLGIEYIDIELSRIFDSLNEKIYQISIDEIIKATRDRIIIALETFA